MNEIKLIKEVLSKCSEMIYETERFLWNHPETGYREWVTNEYLKDRFLHMGYELVEAGNIPGFYIDIDTRKPGPCIAILGEMDALPCESHPAANPVTKAAHACGHHCQCAILVGVAAALCEPEIINGLCGRIRLIAVPAEEIVELDFRESLQERGIIRYLQGKPEFIYRGYFDGVDMAMLIHAGSQTDGTLIKVRKGSTCGCIVKKVTFWGKSAHAGARPEHGINALYAAKLGLSAVNSLRERFLDDEHIRFHPIISNGGDAINQIPSKVVLESYLRGSNIHSILAYNKVINQAFAGAAVSIGAKVEIKDYAASFPMQNNLTLREVLKEAVESLYGKGTCLLTTENWSPGGTDLGNLSTLMPVIQASSTGATGVGHSNEFMIQSPYHCCQIPAECLVKMIRILLKNEAEKSRVILKNANPIFQSKEEYFEIMESISKSRSLINYLENGVIEICIDK